MESIIVVLVSTIYSFYVMCRVVQKKDGNTLMLYLTFPLVYSTTIAISQFTGDGEMLTVSASIGCTVCEFLMVSIVGYWAVDDMWIQYARVLEAFNVKTLISISVMGIKKSLLRTTMTGNGTTHEDVLLSFFVLIIAIIVSEILLKYNLYGRIPYVIWKWFLIVNYSLVVINVIRLVISGRGVFETNNMGLIYITGIIPVLAGICIFVMNLIFLLKNEVRELEKYYGREYEKYQSRARQYEEIRTLRHDLANHLQVLSTLNEEEKNCYLDELMMRIGDNYGY